MTDYSTSTPEQHARHDAHADMFCANINVLCDLAANHSSERVRHAAARAIYSFGLLKADPAGPHALCGPRVKQAIANAVEIIGVGSPSAMAN